MNAPAVKRMTIPDFLAWCERQERSRYELVDGEIVAMAPERRGAVTGEGAKSGARWPMRSASRRALRSLRRRRSASRSTCRPSMSPTYLVNCGERIAPEAMLAPCPRRHRRSPLVASSRTIDKSVKLAGYFKLDSLRHYLVVDLEHRTVLHYGRRGADEPILLRIVTEGAIRLDPPGLDLTLTEIFA